MNQYYFDEFLFHLIEVVVGVGFVREKKFVLNSFCTAQVRFVEKL